MASDSATPTWVTLVSEDGYRFVVDYKTSLASPTLKTMLSMADGGGFVEAESNTAKLQIRGEVLEKVIEFLYFKTRHAAASDTAIPDFKNRIPPEIALELLMASDFLERSSPTGFYAAALSTPSPLSLARPYMSFMIDPYHFHLARSASNTMNSERPSSSSGARPGSAPRQASASPSTSTGPAPSGLAAAENNGAAPALPHKLPEFEHFRQSSPLLPEFYPRTSGFFSQTKRRSLTQSEDATSPAPAPAVSLRAIPRPAPKPVAPRSNTDSFTLPLTFVETDALKGEQLPIRLGLAPPSYAAGPTADATKYKTRVGYGYYFYTPPPGAVHQSGSNMASSSDLSIATSKLSRGSSSLFSSTTPTMSSTATSPDSLVPPTHLSGTADSGLSARSFASSASRSRANSTALPTKAPIIPPPSPLNRPTSSHDCWRPESYFNVIHSRVKGKMREFVHHGYPTHQIPYWHGYNKETMDAELATHLNVSFSLKGNTLRPFPVGARPCRVLDLGCGRGAWVLDVARDWNTSEFVGVDIVPVQPPLSQLNDPDINHRVSWVIANFLEPLPFPDACFDFVHMRFLLQGIPEDKWVDVLSEARRVLAPGGVLEVIEGNYLFFGHGSLIDAQELKDLESGAAASKPGSGQKLPKRLKVLRDPGDTGEIDSIEIVLERMMHRRFINPAPLSIIPSNLVMPGFYSIANGNPRHIPVYAESSAQRAKARAKEEGAEASTGDANSSEDEAKWLDKYTNRTQMGKQLKSQFKLPDNDLFSAFNIMQSLEYFSSSREIIWAEAEEEKRSMQVQSPWEHKPWDHNRGFGQGCPEALRPYAHPWKSKDQFFRALDSYIEAMVAVCDLDFILEKYLGWEQCSEELTVEGRKHAERQRKMSTSGGAHSSLKLETTMQQEAQSDEKIMALAALRQGAFSPTAYAIATTASQEAPARLQTTARMSIESEDSRQAQLSKMPASTEKKKKKASARPSSSAGALGSSTPHSSMTPRVRSFGRGGAGNSAYLSAIPDSSFVGSESFGFSSAKARRPTVLRTKSFTNSAQAGSDLASVHSTISEREDESPTKNRSPAGNSISLPDAPGTPTAASTYAATQRGRVEQPVSPAATILATPVQPERDVSPSSGPSGEHRTSLPNAETAEPRSRSKPARRPATATGAPTAPLVGNRSSSHIRSVSKDLSSKPIAMLGFYDCTGFLAIA